jgi:hypothetical protein
MHVLKCAGKVSRLDREQKIDDGEQQCNERKMEAQW